MRQTIVQFLGDPNWYRLVDFVDPSGIDQPPLGRAKKPTGWVLAQGGGYGERWIDLDLAYSMHIQEIQ